MLQGTSTDFVMVVIVILVIFFLAANFIHRFFSRFWPQQVRRIRYLRFRIVVAGLIFSFLTLVITPIVLLPVRSGEVGVIWSRFGGGTDTTRVIGEGVVFVWPWDKLFVYSARFKSHQQTIEAVTSEGLNIALEVVYRYRPIASAIPLLHKRVGPEYVERLIVPEVGSATRLIVSEFTAEQVYGNQRRPIQTAMFNEINTGLRFNDIQLIRQAPAPALSELVHLEDVLIRGVVLPTEVEKAIIRKVNQKYLDEEYSIRLLVEQKEARRKALEAKGVAAFQQVVSGGISENYLRWRGIEATLELAKSDNTKIVVIGGGEDGLPLILNDLPHQPVKQLDEAEGDTSGK